MTHEHSTDNNGPDMPSMLDIIFILLIFFIITASFIQENGVEINSLPSPRTEQSENDTSITISVKDMGKYYINGHYVEKTWLTAIIKQAFTEKPDIALIINAAPEANMGDVIAVYDTGRIAGLGIHQIFSTIKRP
jgi:biopolymer transport protein ExbD